MRRAAFAAALCVGIAIIWWLGSRGRPPVGVPGEAVQVTFSKEGGWAYCWVDVQINLNRCRTYNWAGERLYRPGKSGDLDDVFVRYLGEGPVPETELQIDPAHTQQDFVWLRNGVVLLPRNDLANQKALIDMLVSARDH
ncbi:MAG: hypothetical protein ABJA98_10455 [Acidobacteriota bacterium]